MDIQLYVYDLSRGLARRFSQQFLGTHIGMAHNFDTIIVCN